MQHFRQEGNGFGRGHQGRWSQDVWEAAARPGWPADKQGGWGQGSGWGCIEPWTLCMKWETTVGLWERREISSMFRKGPFWLLGRDSNTGSTGGQEEVITTVQQEAMGHEVEALVEMLKQDQ